MHFKQALLICFFFTFFYAGTYPTHYSTDTIVTSFLPLSIIRGDGFDLKKIYPVISRKLPSQVNDTGVPYYIVSKNNHYFSAFPVFSSLLAVPIYFFPVFFKNITLDNIEDHFNLIITLGKISASLFSAISVTFVFLSLREFATKEKALILTILYALGTSTLSISSQALWQHSASQMLLSCCMYLIIKGKKQLLPLCGFLLGLATLCRFSNIIIAACFFVYVFALEKKRLLPFVLWTIPSVVFIAWYQITYPGNLFFYKYEAIDEIANFHNSFLIGFLGLLIAPSKGLFIYSPFLLFSSCGIVISWMKKNRLLMFFSVLTLLYITFIAKWSAWHGGWSYGPRMLADITPFLTLLLVPVVINTRIWKDWIFKITFFLSAFLSMFIHFLGVSVADFSWYSLQTRSLTLEQAHQAAFLWNWEYPEIYHFFFESRRPLWSYSYFLS